MFFYEADNGIYSMANLRAPATPTEKVLQANHQKPDNLNRGMSEWEVEMR